MVEREGGEVVVAPFETEESREEVDAGGGFGPADAGGFGKAGGP